MLFYLCASKYSKVRKPMTVTKGRGRLLGYSLRRTEEEDRNPHSLSALGVRAHCVGLS